MPWFFAFFSRVELETANGLTVPVVADKASDLYNLPLIGGHAGHI